MNTLFRKGYLLAGVIMAANMFVVNEMRAMETTDDENRHAYFEEIGSEGLENGRNNHKKNSLTIKKVLSFAEWVPYYFLAYDNYINLFVGVVSSVANNYLKLWDYNPWTYREFGRIGLRSGRLIKDIFQFDINLDLGRGVFWLIVTFFGSYAYIIKDKMGITDLKNTAAVFMASVITKKWRNGPSSKILFFFLSNVQGFVSAPLAIHFSNFSISISLDSILWGLVKISTIFMKNKRNEEPYYDIDLIRSSSTISDEEQNNNNN